MGTAELLKECRPEDIKGLTRPVLHLQLHLGWHNGSDTVVKVEYQFLASKCQPIRTATATICSKSVPHHACVSGSPLRILVQSRRKSAVPIPLSAIPMVIMPQDSTRKVANKDKKGGKGSEQEKQV